MYDGGQSLLTVINTYVKIGFFFYYVLSLLSGFGIVSKYILSEHLLSRPKS